MSVQYLGEHAPTTFVLLPLHVERVSAGFPSPAQDYIEAPLDLNELCVRHPAAKRPLILSGRIGPFS